MSDNFPRVKIVTENELQRAQDEGWRFREFVKHDGGYSLRVLVERDENVAELRDRLRFYENELQRLSLALTAQAAAAAAILTGAPGPNDKPTLNVDEIALIRRGEKIPAIKSLRARYSGLGLKEAKDIVDAYR